MLKNYLKTALRSFWNNKVFSVINIAGLSIGISASLVIYLLVVYDFDFDKFEKDSNRIYRVVSNFSYAGVVSKSAGVAYPIGDALRSEVTGLDAVAAFRIWHGGYRGIKVGVPGETKGQPTAFLKQEHIVFADENYFKLLSYTWLAGSPKTSLKQPYQVVLAQSKASLYFPNIPASEIIGKELYFDDSILTTVTGIVKDIDANTDFTFKTFISRQTLNTKRLMPDAWNFWGSTDPDSQVFIKLAGGSTAQSMQAQIEKLAAKYEAPAMSNDIKVNHALQPLSDVHFNADFDNFNARIANKPALYGLLAVAAFLLLLASINFINLTTAQAYRRAREIGIRKTMGSSKKQLMFQFLSETFLLTAIATLLSTGLTPLLLQIFSSFLPQGLHFNLINQPGIIIFLCLLILSVSLLSGFYPALILSSFKPVLVLKKNAFTNGGKTRSVWLRKTLTITQFSIAQVFIIATILVSKQINYSLTADMGFKKDAILYFGTNYNDTVASHKFILRNKLKAIPEVAMVSLSNTPASYSGGIRGGIMKYKNGNRETETHVKIKFADTNYIRLYQMKLLAGTNLPNSDTIRSLLINETYAHILGFKNPTEAIGKYINWNDWGITNVPIAGVLQDFHLRSFHEIISPLVISSRVHEQLTFNVALQPLNAEGTNWKTAISKIQKAWKEVYPDDVLEYQFMDETVAKYYDAEQNTSTLLSWATGLSVFISCLGLLGLVIYITSQRTKEIGIRKVVGATVTQLVTLLSKDFLKLVVIAFVIAVPLTWWGANAWLQNFAYKTPVSWWIFLAGGVIMLLLAFIILSIRIFKAANANPVTSLRAE